MGQGVANVRTTDIARMARLAEQTKARCEAMHMATVPSTVQQRGLRCILVHHNHQDSMATAEKATETTIVR